MKPKSFATSTSTMPQNKSHYPWLAEFDGAVKSSLTTLEVTSSHVLKLLTFLESHVSSEVSKLRNKPNRASRFLTQLRKRISLVKVGGYMIEPEKELELLPTYGLLMTHIVNITLVSSMIGKFGAQSVASDLYYSLKLMFYTDSEYVLDVALTSNLSENAGSEHEVGFQLFSLIVEDWKTYCTNSAMMKCFTVASMLAENSDGKKIVERSSPTTITTSFRDYLRRTTEFALNPPKKLNNNMRLFLENINTRKVCAMSRSRLVVVSKKRIIGSRYDYEDDDSDGSTSSTVVNVAALAAKKQKINGTHPNSVEEIMSDLGLGFSLDTVGNEELREMNIDVENEGEESFYNSPTSEGGAWMKSAVYGDFTLTNSMSSNEAQETESTIEIEEIPRRGLLHMNDINDGFTFDNNNTTQDEKLRGNQLRKNLLGELDSEKDNLKSGKRKINELNNKEEEMDFEANDDKDSDLEIVSVQELDLANGAESDGYESSSRDRDEAEAESGEDEVSDYDVDSDADTNTDCSSTQSENQTKTNVTDQINNKEPLSPKEATQSSARNLAAKLAAVIAEAKGRKASENKQNLADAAVSPTKSMDDTPEKLNNVQPSTFRVRRTRNNSSESSHLDKELVSTNKKAGPKDESSSRERPTRKMNGQVSQPQEGEKVQSLAAKRKSAPPSSQVASETPRTRLREHSPAVTPSQNGTKVGIRATRSSANPAPRSKKTPAKPVEIERRSPPRRITRSQNM